MTEAAGSAAVAGNSADSGNTAAATATTATTTTDVDWTSGLDDDSKGLIEVKGWKGPKDAIDSYRNLERLVGSERIAKPKDENDKAGWDKVFNALGRPDNADGYKIAPAEGADPAFAKTMAEAFHEAGLSLKQAQLLAGKYQEFATGVTAEAQQAADAKSEQEMTAFRNELGAKYDETIEAIRRVVKADGLTPDELTAVEMALGTGRFLRVFAKRAGEVLEDKGPEGTLRPSMTLTPAGAKAKIAELQRDDSFMKKYMNEDPMVRKDAIAEMERLHKLAAGVAA